MPAQVYRCAHCRREVLVRLDRPLTDAEAARRRDEEMRPTAPGRRGALSGSERMRDDIWIGISGEREPIPRDRVPDHCPACGHANLERARVIE